MEILKKVHSHNLIKWAQSRPEVLVLSADLTSSCEADLFRETYPDRFISLGIAEQNMVSFAAGLAREGFTPYVHTFGVFLYRRAYDQIAMSVAYSNLKVRLVGFLPGITTPGGASHQAIDDISLMKSLPNMTVLECGDATDVESVLDVAQSIDGPVYIRMLRGEIPRIFEKNNKMILNQARIVSEGEDITLLTTGICTEEAIRATQFLKTQGISINHLHISTLKPFNDQFVIKALKKKGQAIITMENHIHNGGLGTAVAELMIEHEINKKLFRISLGDTFSHGASRAYLMRKHGIDAQSLIETVAKALNKNLSYMKYDLKEKRIEQVHSDAKAEGL